MDDRINHRKVYARGFYDGLAAAGGDLKADKVEEKLRGQSAQVQKTYAAVPIQEWWSAAQVGSAIQRASGAAMDRKTLDACLHQLKDAGLVQKRADGTFCRARVAEEKEVVAKTPPDEAILVKGTDVPLTTKPEGNGPFERMAALAGNMRLHATYLNQMASEVEAIALELEERRESDDVEAQKLRQLKSLLKELA
jgi:hypothetical protein